MNNNAVINACKYDNGDLIQQFVVDAELSVLNNQENILGKIK